MKILKNIFIVIFISTFMSCIAFAEDLEDVNVSKTIKKIDIKGNVSINKNVILSQIKAKPSDLFLRDLINEDLRRIYSLGYFSDISVDIEEHNDGIDVYFVVVEKFSIKSVNISGNKIIKKPLILKELGIKEGEVFNKRLVQEALKKVESLYKKKGYYNAKAELLINTRMAFKQVDLTIKISENKRIFVKKIKFDGNVQIKYKKLKKQMQTKEKWFFVGGVFDKNTLEADLEKLTAYYRFQGFMNAKVGQPEIIYENRYVYITIPIEEGPQYKTGIIELEGVCLFPEKEVLDLIKLKQDMIFSQEKMFMDQAAIKAYYSERGYIFATIKPETFINTDEHIIDITYIISEKELAYIEKILIKGNTRTKDKVIRRNLSIYPLEPFDGKKLQRSKEKLFNLNYFEDVEFNTLPGTKEDYRDLVVNVKEKKTGEFSFGGGYSSLDGMIGFIQIAQNNFDLFNFPSFIGGGQKMRVRAELGSSKTSYEISFTEPWLFDRPLLAGFDIYNKSWERTEYEENRKGFNLRAGHPVFNEYNYFSTMFKHELVDIKITDTVNVSNEIRLEEGEKTVNSMRFTFTRDTRNNKNFTQKGYKWLASIEPEGGILGGDIDIIRYYASADHYWPLWYKNWVLSTTGKIGAIDKYEDTVTVPVYERFFVGGSNSVRGYKERHVGPKSSSLDPIGGSSMVVLNAEVSFPLLEVLRGAVFADAGNAWVGGNDWAFNDLKKGVGVGVRIKTPFGPVKLDYGFALDNAADEDDSRLHFSMGGMF